MRPMAFIAVGELILVCYLLWIYVRARHAVFIAVRHALGVQREDHTAAMARQEVRHRSLMDDVERSHRLVVEQLSSELEKALDRVTAPQLAAEEALARRAMAGVPEGADQAKLMAEAAERSLGDDEREAQKRRLDHELKIVEEELERRGIDPSQLSSETAVSSVG